MTGLQGQGLQLSSLAVRAQQEAAGRDLDTLARQVLSACQLPVALRVVATSDVDSSSFNVLQTCNTEAVAPTCAFARQINDTVSSLNSSTVSANVTTSLLPGNLTSLANATGANATGGSGNVSLPGVGPSVKEPLVIEDDEGKGHVAWCAIMHACSVTCV